MTLQDLERAVYRRIYQPDDPAGDVRIRIQGFLNERHKEILTDSAFAGLRRSTLTFASVASQARYGLGPGVESIERVWEATNDAVLYPRTPQWYRTIEPDPDSFTGTPDCWIDFGVTAQQIFPGTATGIWAVSSSASDTTPTVTITGIRTGGVPLLATTATLTGTTRVQIGSLTDIREIATVALSKAAVGTVTLYNASSSGDALLAIPIGKTSANYRSVALYPTPSDVITYSADIVRLAPTLTSPTDEPLIPEAFHDMLVAGARMDEYERNDDSRYDKALRVWVQRKRDLKAWMYAQQTRVATPMQGVRPSRLGPYYPAGT